MHYLPPAMSASEKIRQPLSGIHALQIRSDSLERGLGAHRTYEYEGRVLEGQLRNGRCQQQNVFQYGGGSHTVIKEACFIGMPNRLGPPAADGGLRSAMSLDDSGVWYWAVGGQGIGGYQFVAGCF